MDNAASPRRAPLAETIDLLPRRILSPDTLESDKSLPALYPFAARMPAPDRAKPDAAALPHRHARGYSEHYSGRRPGRTEAPDRITAEQQEPPCPTTCRARSSTAPNPKRCTHSSRNAFSTATRKAPATFITTS